MLVVYIASNVECKRSSDIIIMGKSGWGGMGNLIKTGK